MEPTTRFRVDPIPAAVLARVRATGTDVSGNPVHRLVAEGGDPLRCCLRDALPGEPLLLFGYEPPLPGVGSPYREIGAVFAHAEPCDGPAADRYPADWHGRPQVVRSYDARGWIRDGRAHDGTDPEGVIDELLADPEAVLVHSRNIGWGCFMFTASRDGS